MAAAAQRPEPSTVMKPRSSTRPLHHPSLPPAFISLVIYVWRALGGNAAAWAGVKEPSRAVGSRHGTARYGLGVGRRTSGAARPCVRGALLSVFGSFDRSCAGHSPAAVGTGGTQAWGLQQLRFSSPSWANTFPQTRRHENSVRSSARPGIWAQLIPAPRAARLDMRSPFLLPKSVSQRLCVCRGR